MLLFQILKTHSYATYLEQNGICRRDILKHIATNKFQIFTIWQVGNNMLLSISCKSVVKNIVDVTFFSIFLFDFPLVKKNILFIDYK